MKKVSFYGKSDIGRVRANNEDAFLLCNIWDDDHILAVAIDGVGGYEGGEVAAALAQETIYEFLNVNTPGDCLGLIKEAVIAANNRIFSEREQNPSIANMGCVLTASLIELESMRVNIAHVGDTRIYQYASSQIEKLSHDHSLIGYREEIGDLTEEEAMTHPQRNIISRDVGARLLSFEDKDYVEVASFPLENNTQLLLCSDGLCDMITSKAMSAILEEHKSVEDKVNSLIQAALDAGGRDNVTVVLVCIESDEVVQDDDIRPEVIEFGDNVEVGEEAERKPGKKNKKWLTTIILLMLVAAVCIGIFSGQTEKQNKTRVKNISADTTEIAEPADTTSQKDTLLSSGNHPDGEVDQNISDEN